jgi:hypothetical protein
LHQLLITAKGKLKYKLFNVKILVPLSQELYPKLSKIFSK